MAVRWAMLILGINKPLAVSFISKAAVGCGITVPFPIPTCALALTVVKSKMAIKKCFIFKRIKVKFLMSIIQTEID
jgi:hypothetical protein